MTFIQIKGERVSNNFNANIFTSFQSIWMEFCAVESWGVFCFGLGCLLAFCCSVLGGFFGGVGGGRGVCCLINIEGRESYLRYFDKGNFNVGFYWGIYGPCSFKLGMMAETNQRYILMPVYVTWTFIQGHNCMRNQKVLCSFWHKFHRQFG